MLIKLSKCMAVVVAVLLLGVAAVPGVASAASGARFADNGNGTFVDNLTSLIWTKDGNTPGPAACTPATLKTWRGAQEYVDCLNVNKYLGFEDWRLPDVVELGTLANNAGRDNIAAWLNAQGFSNVQDGFYWSLTAPGLSLNATAVNLHYGFSYAYKKTANNFSAWPVRGGSK